MQPDPCARWVSSLHCGHQARTRGRPRLGQIARELTAISGLRIAGGAA